jgi:hypothetical protein
MRSVLGSMSDRSAAAAVGVSTAIAAPSVVASKVSVPYVMPLQCYRRAMKP